MKKTVKIFIIMGTAVAVIALGLLSYTKIGVITDWYHTAENWVTTEYAQITEKTAQIKFILSENTTAAIETPTDSAEEVVTDEEIMFAALRSSSDEYLRQTYPDLTDEQIAIMIDNFIDTAKNGPFAWTISTAQNAIVSYYDEAYQAIQQNSEGDSE